MSWVWNVGWNLTEVPKFFSCPEHPEMHMFSFEKVPTLCPRVFAPPIGVMGYVIILLWNPLKDGSSTYHATAHQYFKQTEKVILVVSIISKGLLKNTELSVKLQHSPSQMHSPHYIFLERKLMRSCENGRDIQSQHTMLLFTTQQLAPYLHNLTDNMPAYSDILLLNRTLYIWAFVLQGIKQQNICSTFAFIY